MHIDYIAVSSTHKKNILDGLLKPYKLNNTTVKEYGGYGYSWIHFASDDSYPNFKLLFKNKNPILNEDEYRISKITIKSVVLYRQLDMVLLYQDFLQKNSPDVQFSLESDHTICVFSQYSTYFLRICKNDGSKEIYFELEIKKEKAKTFKSFFLKKRQREVEMRACYLFFEKIYSLKSTHPFYVELLEQNQTLWERLQKFNQKLTKREKFNQKLTTRVTKKRVTKEQLVNSFINQSSLTHWMQYGFIQEKHLRFKTYILSLYLINKALSNPLSTHKEDLEKVHFNSKELEPLHLNNIRTLKSCLDELRDLEFEFISTQNNEITYEKAVGFTEYSLIKINKIKTLRGQATINIKFFKQTNPCIIFESRSLIHFQHQNSLVLRNLSFSRNIQKAFFFIIEKKPESMLVLDFRTYVNIKKMTYLKHQDIFIRLIKELQANEGNKVQMKRNKHLLILTYTQL